MPNITFYGIFVCLLAFVTPTRTIIVYFLMNSGAETRKALSLLTILSIKLINRYNHLHFEDGVVCKCRNCTCSILESVCNR